jgi:hypothetical protein
VDDVDAVLQRSLEDLFWLPPWATVVDESGCLYTHSPRDQHALNQVVRVSAETADLPGIVAAVDAAHQGVTSRWLLSRDSQHPALPPLLLRAGWTPEHRHHVRAIRSDADIAVPAGVTARAVTDVATLTDCIRVCERAFGSPEAEISAERVRDELGMATGPAARVHRFVAYDDASGAPMASGGLNVFPDLALGFLWAGGTDPAFRRRGAYRAVLAARLRRAAERGCTMVAIYARDSTSDPVVASLGFARHGTMVTWRRGPQTAP